jgi:hypothetical protein
MENTLTFASLFPTTSFTCPKCGCSYTEQVCDNDCGTFKCGLCLYEFFLVGEHVIGGHVSTCGEDSDTDLTEEDLINALP